jgi:Cu+-exporting ATPase
VNNSTHARDGDHHHHDDHDHGHSHDTQSDEFAARDPVCGMSVDSRTALTHTHAGHAHFFCSAGCRTKFVANPAQYLDAAAPAGSVARATAGLPAHEAAATIWTCPMHPEVRSEAPGSCPICGMALEPLEPSADAGENHELADMTRRFWIATALSVPLLWAMLGEMLPAVDPMRLFGHSVVAYAELALATPAVLWAGWPFLVRGWQSVVNRSLNMFSLIALATCFTSMRGSIM